MFYSDNLDAVYTLPVLYLKELRIIPAMRVSHLKRKTVTIQEEDDDFTYLPILHKRLLV